MTPLLLAAAMAVPDANSAEFLVFGADRVTRLALRVEIDGQPLEAVWTNALTALFADLDRDSDNRLTPIEAARAPSALRVRQLGWSYLFAVPASAPWIELDVDKNGSVSRSEFLAYYRRSGAAGVQVAVGTAPSPDVLTDALVKHLDTDHDGKVNDAEWRAADVALKPLDRDADGLIRPGELVPRTPYPGTFGGLLLTPPGPSPAPRLAEELSLLRLPTNSTDTHWVERWIARRNGRDNRLSLVASGLPAATAKALDRDHDGWLTVAELASWRQHSADETVVVRLGRKDGADGARHDLGDVRAWVYTTPSRLSTDAPAAWRAARGRFAQTAKDESLTLAEATATGYAPLRDHFTAADRDADGRLTRTEWDTYLSLRASLAAAQVTITVLDHGAGLFEQLDTDADGALSVRELRQATTTSVKRPRHLRFVVSSGLPSSLLRVPGRAGPEWFRAMDRNGDGDVSRAEFVGPAEVFEKLDINRDGFLDPIEAAVAKPIKP